MQTEFEKLYHQMVQVAARKEPGGLARFHSPAFDPHQVDCLLHPKQYAPVWQTGLCECGKEDAPGCVAACIFNAITRDETGKVIIDPEKCTGCGACIDQCPSGKLTASRDILPVLEALKNATGPIYAMVAPAFIGQFSSSVTPGKLRTTFKKIGFTGMLEVALFADILTLREALEFDRNILTDQDYMLTSCCCPIWIAMLRKVYSQLLPHVPGSVSPMVACGRTLKQLEPNAVTVFIGPCIAKKSEAREPDIADAVDFVLTFQEVQDLFEAMGLDPDAQEEDERDHSSRAGRIYARTGGVSEAVQSTVALLNPKRAIMVKARQADGVPGCRAMLNALIEGNPGANFLEGMGCVGGCVGGPKSIINREEGREHVDEYAGQAGHLTPLDNPYLMELLKRLGLNSPEDLLKDDTLFTRHF